MNAHPCLIKPSTGWFATVLSLVLAASSDAAVITDPQGDTVNAPKPDIKSLTYVVVGLNLDITVEFFDPILPPSAFDPVDSVGGYIDIDTDQNAATGGVSTLDLFGMGAPPPGLGVEFYVDVFSQLFAPPGPGSVDILGSDFSTIAGTAAITFSSTSFLVSVPLATLGISDDSVNIGATMGTFGDFTDQVPNNTTVPEPSSLSMLLGFGLAGLLGRRRSGAKTRR